MLLMLSINADDQLTLFSLLFFVVRVVDPSTAVVAAVLFSELSDRLSLLSLLLDRFFEESFSVDFSEDFSDICNYNKASAASPL